MTSQLISERVFETKGENAFLCGLIHDIGLIIQDQVVPELFIKAFSACTGGEEDITRHEDAEIGCNHTQVGWHIARDWHLPRAVQEGIRDHHNTRIKAAPDSTTGIVRIGEYLVNRMDFTPFPGILTPLPKTLLSHMHSRIRDYKAILVDLPEILEKADDVFGLDE